MPIIKDLLKNDIDILCIQEANIKKDEELDFYQISNYCLEVESVTQQHTKRTLMYIKSDLLYQRIWRLEKDDNHIIVIELHKKKVRIAAMYRTYQLVTYPDHTTALKDQISQLNEIFQHNSKVILLGNFTTGEWIQATTMQDCTISGKKCKLPINFFN